MIAVAMLLISMPMRILTLWQMCCDGEKNRHVANLVNHDGIYDNVGDKDL